MPKAYFWLFLTLNFNFHFDQKTFSTFPNFATNDSFGNNCDFASKMLKKRD